MKNSNPSLSQKTVQIRGVSCTEVSDGFADWVKILLNNEKKFQIYPERFHFHASLFEKEILSLTQRVLHLLDENDVATALDIFREVTTDNQTKVWH